MPDKIAGMPQAVCRRPVTSPHTIPTRKAQSMATATFAPFKTIMTHTAAPVQNEPSTVRSESSKMR